MQRTAAVEDPDTDDFAGLDDQYLWQAMMANPDLAIAVFRLEQGGNIRIVDVNAACEPFGLVHWQAARGLLVDEAAVSEISEYVTPRLRQCIETGVPQSYERAINLPSGAGAWATSLVPVKGRGGRYRFAIAIIRPITTYPSGMDFEDRTRQLLDGIAGADPGLVFIYDGQHRRVTFAGGAVHQLLGLQPDALEQLADPVATLAHPEDLPRLHDVFGQAATNRIEPPAAFECRMRHASGDYRRLLFHSKVIEQNNDGGWHLIGVASDITERAHLQDEVAHLHVELAGAQLKERRLIAQDLHDSAGQQIIAAKLALMVADEHCSKGAMNDKIRQSLDDIRSCLDNADREIRVLSYIFHPPAIGDHDLATVLTSFAMGFGGRAGVMMDVSVNTRINQFPGLSMTLLRVFQEALTNVHRHARASLVHVRLDVSGASVELEIRDDGIGIASASTKAAPAHGVGLTIMGERINDLGGKLVIDGTKGTTIKALIPIPRAPEGADAQWCPKPAETGPAMRLQGERIWSAHAGKA